MEKEENSVRTGRSWGWEIEGETDRFCQRVFDIADIDMVELLWGRGGANSDNLEATGREHHSLMFLPNPFDLRAVKDERHDCKQRLR